LAVTELGDYAEKLIRHKAKRLVGKAGLTISDVPDLEQDMKLDLLRRLSKFDPSKAQRNTFIARVVEHSVATIIESRKAGLRDYRRCTCSLNDPTKDLQGKPIERGDAMDQEQRRLRTGSAGRTPAEDVDLAVDVAEVVSDLPPELRDLCRRLKTQSPTEVSQETGIPRGTLYESFETLRRRFEKARLREYL